MPIRASVEDVGIDHCSDVMSAFQQMGGKGMAEAMGSGRFGDPCAPHGFPNHFLNQARIKMVSALFPGIGIAPALMLGEHPWPVQLPGGIPVVLEQRSWQLHLPVSFAQIILVQAPHRPQLLSQALAEPHREHRAPILAPPCRRAQSALAARNPNPSPAAVVLPASAGRCHPTNGPPEPPPPAPNRNPTPPAPRRV